MTIETCLLIAVIVAIIVVCIVMIRSHRAEGTLRIDHSNPEKDVYRFEVKDLDKLNTKSYIILKIDHNADLSQN